MFYIFSSNGLSKIKIDMFVTEGAMLFLKVDSSDVFPFDSYVSYSNDELNWPEIELFVQKIKSSQLIQSYQINSYL